jgi:hypothetical protein
VGDDVDQHSEKLQLVTDLLVLSIPRLCELNLVQQ